MGDAASARSTLQVYMDAPRQRPPMLQIGIIGLLCAEQKSEQALALYREWAVTLPSETVEQAHAEFKLLGLPDCGLPLSPGATTGRPAP